MRRHRPHRPRRVRSKPTAAHKLRKKARREGKNPADEVFGVQRRSNLVHRMKEDYQDMLAASHEDQVPDAERGPRADRPAGKTTWVKEGHALPSQAPPPMSLFHKEECEYRAARDIAVGEAYERDREQARIENAFAERSEKAMQEEYEEYNKGLIKNEKRHLSTWPDFQYLGPETACESEDVASSSRASGAAASPTPTTPTKSVFVIGQRVIARDLTSARGGHLNGRRGVISAGANNGRVGIQFGDVALSLDIKNVVCADEFRKEMLGMLSSEGKIGAEIKEALTRNPDDSLREKQEQTFSALCRDKSAKRPLATSTPV